MAYLTQSPVKTGIANILSGVLIGLVCFFPASPIAQATEVPPGFERMPNGDIKVVDPTTAFAPPGYRINEKGVLVKAGRVLATSEATPIQLSEVKTETQSVEQADEQSVQQSIEQPAAVQAQSEEGGSEENTQAASPLPIEEVPAGFHRMPNGDIMANSPSTAVAPEGFRLIEGGILRRLDDPAGNEPEPMPMAEPKIAEQAAEDVAALEEIPPGYHRMPDGTLMANNPSTAVAPAGYHLMPDGTLMADTGGGVVDHFQHHSHRGGMWMFDYKVEQMYMEGFRDTTKKVSPAQIIDEGGAYKYIMSPTDMTMDMYMFMLMYHTRDYMVMAMAHYMTNDMGMVTRTDVTSTMETSGPGDTEVTISYQWQRQLAFVGGVSLPTGSIDERGPMVHGANDIMEVKYPYGMQLGSGTLDLIVGANYMDTRGSLAWGADYEYTLRTGTNDNDYTLGDVMLLGGWLKYNLTSEFTVKGKMQLRSVGEIEGEDPELNKNMSPAADAANYGGNRIDAGMAVRYENNKMTSIGFEFTAPVYQDLIGPQMATEWMVGLSVGVMF